MKVSNIILTTLFIAASIGCMQPASAEPQEGGARFQYAPHAWGEHTAKRAALNYQLPVEQKYNVKSGGVPTSNMLGLDGDVLAKPAPPPPANVPNLAARPSNPVVTPQMSKPNFNPLFGKPVQAIAQSLAPMPMQADAKPTTNSTPAAAHPALAAKRRFTTAVAGHLAPSRTNPGIASYNSGYIPGLMPTQATSGFSGSSGSSSSTQVSARIIRQH